MYSFIFRCNSCLNNEMKFLFRHKPNDSLPKFLATFRLNRSYIRCHSCHAIRPLLINNRKNANNLMLYTIQKRNMITAIRLLRNVLKIRYIIVGSAVTGGVQLSRVSYTSIHIFC